MPLGVWVLLLLLSTLLLVVIILVRAFGRTRGALLGLVFVAAAAGGWWLIDRAPPPAPGPGPADVRAAPVSPAECAGCHAQQHESWQRTYHRTMTRDATPENVKGDFSDAVYHYQGLPTRLTREGDAFFMETVDPDWARLRARAGDQASRLPPPRFVKLSVDRLVGSHWIQECMHRTPQGRFVRLPVLYHIVERR